MARRPSLQLATATGLTAGQVPAGQNAAGEGTPSDTPDKSQPRVVPTERRPVSPDSASKLASNIARNRTSVDGFTLDDMIAGPPDPEMDLVPVNVRVPRYVSQALDLAANLTRRRRQEIVADALRDSLPAELLDRTLRKARGESA